LLCRRFAFQGGKLLKIYYDPNFALQELLDYYAPSILEINGEKFIDLHSLNIVNFLGLQPINRYHEEINGWFFNVNEYGTNEILTLENLLIFNDENFEKFKISNALSFEYLKYTEIYNNLFLKVENTLNNLECVIALNNNFLTQHLEVFADVGFEFLLEINVVITIKNLVCKYSFGSRFNHPFAFRIELSNASYNQVYEFLQEFREFNTKISEQIPALYSRFKQLPKPDELERILKNSSIDGFSKTIYNYGSVELFITDLRKLAELLLLFSENSTLD